MARSLLSLCFVYSLVRNSSPPLLFVLLSAGVPVAPQLYLPHHPAVPLHAHALPGGGGPHAPGAPPPGWAVQQQQQQLQWPQQSLQPSQPQHVGWGRGTPVSPSLAAPGRAASPLNPHSQPYRPTARSPSPTQLPRSHGGPAASDASIAAVAMSMPAPVPTASIGVDAEATSTVDASVAVSRAAAFAAAGAAPQPLAAAEAAPSDESCGDQQVSVAVRAGAGAGLEVVSSQPPPTAPCPPAANAMQTVPVKKSWATLAAAAEVPAAKPQFRPHFAPQRLPGQPAVVPGGSQGLPQHEQAPGISPGGSSRRGQDGNRVAGTHDSHAGGRGARSSSRPHPVAAARSMALRVPAAQDSHVGSPQLATAAASRASSTPAAAALPPPAFSISSPLTEALVALCAETEPPAGGPQLHVQPRGLLNPGNLCFVNSIMQVRGGCLLFH